MVIQRVQTLFIVLSIALTVIFFFVPFGYVDIAVASEGLKSVSLKAVNEIGMVVPMGLAILLMVIGIFTFKKLPVQKLLVVLSIVCLGAALITVIYFLSSGMVDVSDGDSVAKVYWGGGGLLLLAAIISLLMAYRGICADQRLLKSYDSFR